MREKKIAYSKISIITVSYNAVKTIEQTILSVLNQTYSNIEYIIIDGSSTDGTVDIIKKYDDKISYWVSEPDKGIYDAMNKGIDVATGEYLYFIQVGDLLRTDALQKVVPFLSYNKCNFVYGNVYMQGDNKVYGGFFNKWKISVSNICQQAIFYHKKIFNIVGKHNLKYKVYADHDLNIKCFACDEIGKVYVDEIIADFEEGGFSSKVIDENFRNDRLYIIKKRFGTKYFLYATLRKIITDIKKYLTRKNR